LVPLPTAIKENIIHGNFGNEKEKKNEKSRKFKKKGKTNCKDVEFAWNS
jgi:hypothetical protein